MTIGGGGSREFSKQIANHSHIVYLDTVKHSSCRGFTMQRRTGKFLIKLTNKGRVYGDRQTQSPRNRQAQSRGTDFC